MKCRFKLLSFALLIASASTYAQKAPQPWYGELAVAPVKVKAEGDSVTSKNLRGIIGYELHPNLAVEGLLSLGVKDGTSTIAGETVETRVDRTLGLYVRPKLAVTPAFEVFGRVGYASSRITDTWRGLSVSETESSASYGLGAAYRINDQLSAVADYMRYYSKDGVKLQGLSVGLRMKF